MSRIAFFAPIALLIAAVLFGLLWTNILSVSFLPSDKAEGWAFLVASVGALVGFVYQLYLKAESKPAPARYLSAPPGHLLPNAIPRPDELKQLRQLLRHSKRPVVFLNDKCQFGFNKSGWKVVSTQVFGRGLHGNSVGDVVCHLGGICQTKF